MVRVSVLQTVATLTTCIATIYNEKGGNCIQCNRDTEQPNCTGHYEIMMEWKHIQYNGEKRMWRCIKNIVDLPSWQNAWNTMTVWRDKSVLHTCVLTEQPDCIFEYCQLMRSKSVFRAMLREECNDVLKTLSTYLIAMMYEIQWRFEGILVYCILVCLKLDNRWKKLQSVEIWPINRMRIGWWLSKLFD